MHACTCNPLMHHNMIITAVHGARMRARVSLVFHTHQSDLCADEDVRHPGGRAGNFPAEYRGGSRKRRVCLRAALGSCVRSQRNAETPTALHQSATASRWLHAETSPALLQSASSKSERALERDAPDDVGYYVRAILCI